MEKFEKGLFRATEWLLIGGFAAVIAWVTAHIAARYYSRELLKQAADLGEEIRLYGNAKSQ